jgi:hypothetical protein
MKRTIATWAALAVAVLTTGCIEQRYVITSSPVGGAEAVAGRDFGATVYRNGVLLGQTPVDDHFVYYGKYHFTLVRDGYETLQIDQDIPTPWYEWPGIDFFTEVVYPLKVRDVRAFHYQMQELQRPPAAEVLQHGQQLRDRGQAINPGPAAPQPPPTPPVLAPPLPDAPLMPPPDAPPAAAAIGAPPKPAPPPADAPWWAPGRPRPPQP